MYVYDRGHDDASFSWMANHLIDCCDLVECFFSIVNCIDCSLESSASSDWGFFGLGSLRTGLLRTETSLDWGFFGVCRLG